MDLNPIVEVKRQSAAHLLSRQNVVACGVGFKRSGRRMTDELCVVVSVSRKVPESQLSAAHIIPQALNGVPTDVQETGMIRALFERTAPWRPAPGGVSIGHVDITAGTLGCLVERDGEIFILSNNHVLANTNAGRAGDPILQPGPYDGGEGVDCIATLEDFVPIDFGQNSPTCPVATGVVGLLNRLATWMGSRSRLAAVRQASVPNRVDAALARPLSDETVGLRILGIGVPAGSREATLGTAVRKSGRTTGLTDSVITQIDVTCSVSYDGGRSALFDDQLMAGAMSQGGDSGAAVVDNDDFVVGLLFAGSDAATIINPIALVLDALGVEIAV